MILRNAIVAVAVLLFLVTIAAAVEQPGARGPALVLALLVAAILFENSRYRMRNQERPEGLTRTNERFVDPETGKAMRVWIGRAGDRHYLED